MESAEEVGDGDGGHGGGVEDGLAGGAFLVDQVVEQFGGQHDQFLELGVCGLGLLQVQVIIHKLFRPTLLHKLSTLDSTPIHFLLLQKASSRRLLCVCRSISPSVLVQM